MTQRCLFCKKPSHGSKSVEHIIPESIGSKKIVLPSGVVCDKCNNYFSIKVEAPVLSHPSFRNIRAWHQVPNKKGKYPSLKGWIAGTDIEVNISLSKEGKLNLQAENNANKALIDKIKEGTYTDYPPLLFAIDISPPQFEMSRFLVKMALEAYAFRFISAGSDIDMLIDEPHFDLARNFARLGNNIKHWPYSRRVIFPIDTNMRHPTTGEWVQAGFGHDFLYTPTGETYFIFLIYGVEFCINLGGPAIAGYENWLVKFNNISPVIERLDCKITTKTINNKKQYFIEGEMDMKKGIKFDIEHNERWKDKFTDLT